MAALHCHVAGTLVTVEKADPDIAQLDADGKDEQAQRGVSIRRRCDRPGGTAECLWSGRSRVHGL